MLAIRARRAMLGRMKLSERLETAECRKDSKARRVSNVAPDKLANVTADQLENGMTLEAIEALNVPTFAYQTQITIHGKLPAFNESARPGGYRAVFLNGNGSVGVRYCAIDADKKALLERAARVSESGWNTARNSTGFEISRSFRPKWQDGAEVEGSREQAKQDTLAALRSLPVARFYGSAFAGCLAYGMGYYVAADIGAIPAPDLWPLIAEVFAVVDLADLEAREAVKQAERDASNAAYAVERDARAAAHAAKLATLKASLGVPLAAQPTAPGSVFRLLDTLGHVRTIALSGSGKRVFYTVTHEDGNAYAMPKRKVMERGWPSAAKEGRLFPA